MKYLISVVAEEAEDSYSSAGPIYQGNIEDLSWVSARQNPQNFTHPFTPFQMTPPGSSDYIKKIAGIWWLRNDTRFKSMRYWNQFSDYDIFPGIIKFDSVPDLLQKLDQANLESVKDTMNQYNGITRKFAHSFWYQTYQRAFRYVEAV
jgi:hypothetical protein